MRIAALPVDKFPKKGSSALSVFADTVISEPGIRAVLENSAPSFYAAVTKNLAEDSKTERTKVLKVARSALKYLSRLQLERLLFRLLQPLECLRMLYQIPMVLS